MPKRARDVRGGVYVEWLEVDARIGKNTQATRKHKVAESMAARPMEETLTPR